MACNYIIVFLVRSYNESCYLSGGKRRERFRADIYPSPILHVDPCGATNGVSQPHFSYMHSGNPTYCGKNPAPPKGWF
jgi:hypothetical protein